MSLMSRVRIKICGITRVEDALAAARLGADAIGINFHPPSRRAITVSTARQILSVLPPFVSAVGLFVNADAPTIRSTAADLHLSHVQLHGDESPQLVAQLRGLAVLKSIRADRRTLGAVLQTWREAIASLRLDNLHGLLLETPHTTLPGGTGVENDWSAIHDHQIAGHFDGLPPVIAAGGLTPDNVASVIRLLRPYAVDVSTGVESAVGQKSPQKMAAIIANACSA
jgi:phosphoribosylanthranilate isomerase